MRSLLALAAIVVLVAIADHAGQADPAETRAGDTAAPKAAPAKETDNVNADAKAFLREYEAALAKLEVRANLAWWKAANSGKKEDFAAAARASLAVRTLHSDAGAYERLKGLIRAPGELPPVEARALQVAELAYRANQLPAELLEKLVELSTEIERTFSTFRAEMDGKRLSNNDLLEMLAKEDDSQRRERIWGALKQVGGAVAPRLVKLAVLRNQAARRLGFDNYWQMQVRLQEQDPRELLAIFDELERLTREPFSEAKAEMDRELAARFKVAPAELMPWHYDNPFFQAAPPTDKMDLDEFYRGKTKEDIVEIARVFYRGIGLPVDDVLKRSDLYERPGKNQHAFCTSINRAADVRTLCNIKPTSEWMQTALHELGHAVYDLHVNRRLPYNLREPAQALTTEGVAMLFGALGENPSWLIHGAGADKASVERLAGAIRRQRRRGQLIFARWTLVMLHFEKDLYEDPQQDLNALWWKYAQRYQQLKRPPGRNRPDWAAKPHFTGAPVYYHNYMLGEMFAAQLRHVLAGLAHHGGPTSDLRFTGRKQFGEYLEQKVFRPGNLMPWPRLVEHATGEPLTARYFAAEVKQQ